MKYLFILGRNPKLSVKEIESFVKRFGNKILNSDLRENGFFVEFEKPLEKNAVDFLGGVISIGEVICSIENLDKNEIYFGSKNNFSYAIWNFSSKYDEVSNYLKKRFRCEKLKASEKKLNDISELQNGGRVQGLKSRTIEEEYFVFGNFFGGVVQKCDYEKIEKRDMEKPVRRQSLSISPRLAKIMINLSEVKEDEILLDAFCGIGVVLQEALLQGIKIIGIDKDKKAIDGARTNLKWFKFEKNDYELINGNSSKVEIRKVQGMASEPDFGETLKKIPTKEKAEAMIRKFESLMIDVLNNVKKYIDGRIVFTCPLIRIGKKRISCDFSKLEEKIGLRLVEDFPISEFRENQIVGRDVCVFE